MKPQPSVSYHDSGFFVWRSPVLPFDEVLDWGRSLRAPTVGGDPERVAGAIDQDRSVLCRRLRAIISRPNVREALFIASPDLEQRLPVWLKEPDSTKGRRIEAAIVRYFERMAARATPFGLFSGCAVGRTGGQTALELDETRLARRHSRLDMHYLATLSAALESMPELRRCLTYRPNSSLYHAAGRLRYAESRLSRSGRSYHLVAVDVTDYLEAALERARTGATPAEIARATCRRRPDVTREEAKGFVEELIESQMLVSDLDPYVTGVEPVCGLISQLRRHPPFRPLAEILDRARTTLREIDDDGPGVDCQRYRDLAKRLETLPAPVELPRLIQVDLFKQSRVAEIGEQPLAEIERAVEILRRFDPPRPHEELERFRDAFVARYEGLEVPLVEALDSEIGIGFGSPDVVSAEAPLLADLGVRGGARAVGTLSWRPAHDVLLEKLLQARAHAADEIVLEQSDLARMSGAPQPLPPAFGVTATIAATCAADVPRGDYRLLFRGCGGPSGARLLGRFCYADAALRERVADHLRREEAHATEAVFAEVTHLPEGRLGNILFRPLLRDHEIPFLGRSGAPGNGQIPVQDLMVSVVMGRIVLRSRRLGREILPRLTTAHNYSRGSLPIYRFLCSLQSQGTAPALVWSWGPLHQAPFLPRVRCGRVVFSRARWSLDEVELRSLGGAESAGRFLRVSEWREARGMPRFVMLTDSDNELLVDLENTLSIDAFADVVKNRRNAVLTEMFPRPSELMARGPEGRFVHEILVPFVRDPAAQPTPLTPARRRAAVERGETPVKRTFVPGSDWLFAKVFTGTSTADRILQEALAPLVRRVVSQGAVDRWFFIRYGDPEWHLRIRFHGRPDRLTGEVLPELHSALEPLRTNGLLWRVQLDTYERETDRYGGHSGIVLAEQAFQIDSEAALAIVSMLGGDEGADARWRIALFGIDRILGDFGLEPVRRLELARRSRQAFGEEFGVDKGVKIRLGNRFRAERKSLVRLFEADGEQQELQPALDVLRARSARMQPIVSGFRRLAEEGRLSVPVEQIAAHLTHMFANRLLLSGQRAQELVLWDFLVRIHDSRLARARVAKPTQDELQRSVS